MIRRPPRSTLFPTRRSSDLGQNGTWANASRTASNAALGDRSARVRPNAHSPTSWPCRYHSSVHENTNTPARSEEHTSELQSRLHLVCRLLLEKKKTQ